MIKGITKNVIEINKLESEYFERVIVILKDCCSEIKEDEVNKQIRLTLSGGPPSFLDKRKRLFALKMIISAASGALVSAAICLLFYLAA